ncbi:MAG: hypothetical protein LIO90_10190 [Bacteroidales bacterium]|nr:hypothetical protein [Bacteroidales bacterium]
MKALSLPLGGLAPAPSTTTPALQQRAELEIALNLAHDCYGGLAPLPVLEGQAGSERPTTYGHTRALHVGATYRHEITYDAATHVVGWTSDSVPPEPHLLLQLDADAELYTVESLGNILILLTSKGPHYLLWQGQEGAYLNLGSHLPDCPLSFGLQSEMVADEEMTITFEESIAEEKIWDELSTANKSAVTSQLLARVNTFIAEQSAKGRFIYPFLVRTAYRLYDGSLTMHSAPVLMVCSSDVAPQVFYSHIYGKNAYTEARVKIVALLHQLDMAAVDTEAVERLRSWSEIVRSIDVFISAPIYTYDQSGEVERFVEVDTDAADCYSLCLHTNQAASTDLYPLRYQLNRFNRLYAMTFCPDTLTYPAGRLQLPRRKPEEVREMVRDCSQFYFLKSLSLDDLSAERQVIEITSHYLDTLTTREAMTDDYQTHDLLIARSAFTYNQRLNLSAIHRRLFAGHHASTLVAHTDGYVAPYTDAPSTIADYTELLRVYFYIKEEREDVVVSGEYGQIGANAPVMTLYYPSTKAYKAVIVRMRSGVVRAWEVKMEPHPFLNAAVYVGPWEGVAADEATTTVPTLSSEEQLTIPAPNKIYTSEVDNPFYFPLEGINSVGTGEVYGLLAAVTALSQGQFGQFPLYAFTSEGIWALTTNEHGTYSAIQPVSRHVVSSAESLTQTDRGVAFLSRQGAMLLEGVSVRQLSLALGREMPMGRLPHLDELMAVHGLTFSGPMWSEMIESGGRIIYDYSHQRLVVHSPEQPGMVYLYAIDSGAWTSAQMALERGLNSYPETYATLTDGSVVSLSAPISADSATMPFFLLTRPLSLGDAQALKRVSSVVVEGEFHRGEVSVALYGTRSLSASGGGWKLVATSTTHWADGICGSPHRWVRVAILGRLAATSRLTALTINYH